MLSQPDMVALAPTRVITHIAGFLLVLNEMVLVLVIERAGISITSTVPGSEHEHEFRGVYGYVDGKTYAADSPPALYSAMVTGL